MVVFCKTEIINLCHFQHLSTQLLHLVLAVQHAHVILIRPSVKQQPRYFQRERERQSRGTLCIQPPILPSTHPFTLTYFVFFVGLPHSFDPTCKEKEFFISQTTSLSLLVLRRRNVLTGVVVMQSGDVETLRSSSSQLEPHRRHGRQLGTEQLCDVVSTRVPLRDRKTSRQTR